MKILSTFSRGIRFWLIMFSLSVIPIAVFPQAGKPEVPKANLELKETKAKAKKGDAEAQFNLGKMYANGQGVPQDYREAVKWFRLAADQGMAGAQNALGGMYARRNHLSASL